MESGKTNMRIVALGILLAVIGGAVSGWWFAKKNRMEIVSVDIRDITEKERQRFVNRYKDVEPTSEIRSKMEREIGSFLVMLDEILARESVGDKVLLSKESVVAGNVKEITKDVEKELLGSAAE